MIRMETVTKAFGPKKVLRGLTLNVPKGTSMVIIGGSGTGKSVTLKCVLGLIAPDSGTPSTDTAPSSGEIRPPSRSASVLFPAPDGPVTAVMLRAGKLASILSNAGLSLPGYRTLTPWRMIASASWGHGPARPAPGSCAASARVTSASVSSTAGRA